MKAFDASTLAFLAGGGEMGARIRAFDWSKTPRLLPFALVPLNGGQGAMFPGLAIELRDDDRSRFELHALEPPLFQQLPQSP